MLGNIATSAVRPNYLSLSYQCVCMQVYTVVWSCGAQPRGSAIQLYMKQCTEPIGLFFR